MSERRVDDPTVTAYALAAGAGDRAALAAFVRATQRDVHRFLVHLHGTDGAEDLAQETYLRALGSLARFAGRSSARTWLLSIARRVAIDQVRAARARPRTTPVDDWDLVLPARSSTEERVVLRALVESLDEERRSAFVLTQMLGMSYAEAAAVCDCPVGTIRSRVARARVDLVAGLRGTGTADGIAATP